MIGKDCKVTDRVACWCTVRHQYIKTPHIICGGFEEDDEPQLEDFLEDGE